MRMTPLKLIVLRSYMLTLGRFAVFSTLLRKVLVKVLIQRKPTAPYAASSRFWDPTELEG
jgi:hypothetical protein